MPGKEEVVPLVELKKNAILVVGSTGTGKSSTIQKCTGYRLRTGDGHKAVTRNCDVYYDDQNYGWVDTVGWDDEVQDDTETFQGILRFLNRHNLTRVKAILWTVHPGTIRQDATLNKQAKLINLFADKDIWDNVIILCKQAMNPEHEARGALNAGYAFHSMSKVQVIGYRYLDDPAFKAEQMALFESQPSMRKDMNILDDAEVKALVTQKIRQIPQDIQIIFNNFRCTACGAEGDSRLLPLYCHMEPEDKHPGAFVKIHPKGTEKYHPAKSRLYVHPGSLRKSICKCGPCGKPPKTYRCCDRRQSEIGCIEKWACCKKNIDTEGCSVRYECCQMDIETAKQGCETVYECCGQDLQSCGCEAVCKKCGQAWGTQTRDCFQKPHQLVELIGKT